MSIIRIVGAPATGKTRLREHIAKVLSLPSFGIDDERNTYGWGDGAWAVLASKVRSHPNCIVETSGFSHNDITVFSDSKTFDILCTASRSVRLARLNQRVQDGYMLARGDTGYVAKLLIMNSPKLTPHAEINSDNGWGADQLQQLVERCRDFLNAGT